MNQHPFSDNSSVDDRPLDGEHKTEDQGDTVNVQATDQQCCSYCGEEDPSSLAMCNICSRWFCNGGHGTSGSHIVLHLATTGHHAIRLHARNLLGDSTLECYVCRSTNMFSLGFMPSKEESVVVLVCREPCLHSKTLRDLNWDSSTWLPLIKERSLLSWMCKVPSVPCKTMTLHDITMLELSWNSEGKQPVDAEEMIPPVPISFKDGKEYMKIFLNMISMDAEASKERKETSWEDIPCNFLKSFGRKYFFILKQLPLSEVEVHRGDNATISAKRNGCTLRGVIIEIRRPQVGNEEAVFEADVRHSVKDASALNEILATTVVNVSIEYNDVGDRRKRKALHMMVNGRAPLSAFLYFTLLGQADEAQMHFSKVKCDLPLTRIPNLNLSQEKALRTALRQPLTLIQGPPGTGKTVTSVAIVYQLHSRIQTQILVCAPSNVAVDHLAERISVSGLKVIRLQAHYREVIPDSVKHIGLDKQVEDFIETSTVDKRLKHLWNLVKEGDTLSDADYVKYKKGVKRIEQILLSHADVICCTCVGAGDKRLEKMRFKYVLIDEATQGTEPESLIPLLRGAKQVFLVGDHCQLGPVVLSMPAGKAGFRRSLFERLLLLGHRALRLDVQYRMHPFLSLFPSNYFYEGTLQNGVTEEQRDASKVFPWPDPTKPIFFYNMTGAEELGANGHSYLNRAEAALTERIVSKLIKDGGVDPDGIGVITPYVSQRRYLKNLFIRCGDLSDSIYDRVEVSSVDAFQGREKEFIILSCVRSNHKQGIGFVADWRRLNVSLTRAKRGIIIMGNVRLLSRYLPWHALLQHLMSMSLIVDGPIEELIPSRVVLQKPKSRFPEGELKLPNEE